MHFNKLMFVDSSPNILFFDVMFFLNVCDYLSTGVYHGALVGGSHICYMFKEITVIK